MSKKCTVCEGRGYILTRGFDMDFGERTEYMPCPECQHGAFFCGMAIVGVLFAVVAMLLVVSACS